MTALTARALPHSTQTTPLKQKAARSQLDGLVAWALLDTHHALLEACWSHQDGPGPGHSRKRVPTHRRQYS